MSAIAATFVACSTVAGRKQARLVFELPIEKLADTLMVLGSPDPHGDIWCGIARLNLEAAKAEPKEKDPARSERAKDQYANMDAMEQARTRAALLCKDQRFLDYMGVDTEAEAAKLMKMALNIKSRAEIASNEQAYDGFLAMEVSYKQATGQFAEIR